MATKALTLFIFSFVSGIFVSSFVFLSPLIAVLIIIVGAATFIDRQALFISLAIISFGLGVLRYDIKDFHEVKEPSSTGIVINDPETKENSKKFVLESDNGERVLVYAPLLSPIQYGDRVEVEGELERAEKYLSREDIYHTLSFADVRVLESNKGNPIKSALFKIKNNFIEQINSILPEPESGLLSGLLVAGKGTLPKNLLDQFTQAGIIHIVVLSGFNITIIALFIRKIFRSRTVALLAVILFVIMAGAEASIVRAAIMATIAMWAKVSGRSYSASRALIFAAFLMILINPKILFFDRSFQLSFLATLGLIYFMKPIEAKFSWITEKWNIRETVSQTLATQMAVFPLLITTMGTFSPLFLPSNVLTILIVPFTMLAGFIATLLSYVSPVVALPLTYVTHLLLSWILFVAQLFGSF